MKHSDKVILYRNGTLAALFIGALVFISIYYAPYIKDNFTSTEAMRSFVLSYGDYGVAVFILFQMLHIFIPVIPGEVVQIAGGYIFGTLPASAYLLSGTFIGTVMVFYISRWIGYPLVRIFVKPARMAQIKRIFNSQKAELIMFILMLIPGFPKDTLVYVAGLSPMSAPRFFVITMLGRMPCLVGSAYIGSNMYSENYPVVILMGVLIAICIGISLYFRKHPFFRIHHEEHKHRTRAIGGPAVEGEMAD